MTARPDGAEAGKFAAAWHAAQLVRDGMALGLGTGSTAAWMVRCVAARARDEALQLTCVATSERTAALAGALGLHVVPLEAVGRLDLTIDGADEVGPGLALVKGGGGAHLREKIVANASDELVVITDPSKEVAVLGAFPLPVEVTPFAHQVTAEALARVLVAQGHPGAPVRLRQGPDGPLVTDEGNRIYDLHLGRIEAPAALDAALLAVPGVVETGLFVGMAARVVTGHPDGRAVLRDRAGQTEITRVDLAAAAALPNA